MKMGFLRCAMNKKWWLVVLLVLLVVLFFAFGLQRYLSLSAIKESQTSLRSLARRAARHSGVDLSSASMWR